MFKNYFRRLVMEEELEEDIEDYAFSDYDCESEFFDSE
jgi:hypothetical protein